MNLKLFSCSIILLVSCVSLITAHGHTHDGEHHHHSHEEDVNPSFKYSRHANEELKKKENPASHNHHGHSHDEHLHHHDHHQDVKPNLKDAPKG